jgi:hypothetical protein
MEAQLTGGIPVQALGMLKRPDDDLVAAGDACFAGDAEDACVDGADGELEHFGNLFGGLPGDDQVDDLTFAPG